MKYILSIFVAMLFASCATTKQCTKSIVGTWEVDMGGSKVKWFVDESTTMYNLGSFVSREYKIDYTKDPVQLDIFTELKTLEYFVEFLSGDKIKIISRDGKGDPKVYTRIEDEERPEPAYVPKNLDDCFVQLREILEPGLIDEMKNGSEEDMSGYHFGLGIWMRNNWRLWGESGLAKWFNEKGINHPDDMSGIILDSFWRHLNNQPIELEVQIRYYQDYWEKNKN